MENKEKSTFDSLNDRQKTFVLNYIKSRVATTAYLDAYSTDKKKLNYETAGANACRMLKDAKVQQAISEKINAIWENKEQEIGKIFDEFIALGFSDIQNILEYKDGVLSVKDFESIDTRAIKKIKIREERSTSKKTDETETAADIIEIELHDKKGSLAELADILGLKKLQVDLTGNTQINFNHKPVTTVEKADE